MGAEQSSLQGGDAAWERNPYERPSKGPWDANQVERAYAQTHAHPNYAGAPATGAPNTATMLAAYNTRKRPTFSEYADGAIEHTIGQHILEEETRRPTMHRYLGCLSDFLCEYETSRNRYKRGGRGTVVDNGEINMGSQSKGWKSRSSVLNSDAGNNALHPDHLHPERIGTFHRGGYDDQMGSGRSSSGAEQQTTSLFGALFSIGVGVGGSGGAKVTGKYHKNPNEPSSSSQAPKSPLQRTAGALREVVENTGKDVADTFFRSAEPPTDFPSRPHHQSDLANARHDGGGDGSARFNEKVNLYG